jgi:hypothetical protein
MLMVMRKYGMGRDGSYQKNTCSEYRKPPKSPLLPVQTGDSAVASESTNKGKRMNQVTVLARVCLRLKREAVIPESK